MLACSAMVACTNEDLLENNGLVGAEGQAYVNVKLVTSTSNGSRSTSDGGYAAGNENLINGGNSIFLFYEEDGHWVTSGVISTETPSKDNVADDKDATTNDKEGTATIVLQGTETELARCAKVLTVINYSGCENLKQLTLDQALNVIATSTADDAQGTKKGFLMSTSVYKDSDGKIINYTEVNSDNICATADLARKNPVIIHVERAAAKVDVAVTTDETKLQLNGDKGIVVDGVITPVQVTIDGWTLNGINENTNIVKKLEDAWLVSGNGDVPFADWNKASDYRSFWAMSSNYAGNNGLTYKKYSQAKTTGSTVEYCYENNVDKYVINYNVVTENHKVTTVLIAAHFNLLDKDGKPVTAQTLYEYNGVYYTDANYKKLILKQLKDAEFKKAITDGVSDLEESDLNEFVTNGTLAGIQVTVKDGTYTKSGEASSKAAIDAVLADLDYVKEAEVYFNGQCYYQVPIEHLAAKTGVNTYTEADGVKTYNFVEGYYGVIRNHHYKLSISAIKNIGEPVYNPEVEIDDIPAKLVDFYMAAELHVLNWHVVNQDVEL